jgi:hypothetical protein
VREIVDNQSRIAALTDDDTPRRHFCYPSGDYAAMFLEWLRTEGVESATTCVPGLAARDSDPLLLPRLVDTMLTPEPTFDAWTSGFAALLPRRASHRLDLERA